MLFFRTFINCFRARSRTISKSGREVFMTRVSNLQLLTFLTKKSVLYVATLVPAFASVLQLFLIKLLLVLCIPKELIQIILVTFLITICNNCNTLIFFESILLIFIFFHVFYLTPDFSSFYFQCILDKGR